MIELTIILDALKHKISQRSEDLFKALETREKLFTKKEDLLNASVTPLTPPLPPIPQNGSGGRSDYLSDSSTNYSSSSVNAKSSTSSHAGGNKLVGFINSLFNGKKKQD